LHVLKAAKADSTMEPKERLKTVGVAAMSALKTQTVEEGGQQPTTTLVDAETVEAITAEWPKMSKKGRDEIMGKYGPPNEATASQLIWYNTRPWKRTIVYRDEVPHNFPQPHTDVVESVLAYQVPLDKLIELAKFDGSLVVERTKGEVRFRCDMEAANFAACNIMHDVVTGKLSAEEARAKMSEVASAYVMNRPSPYAEALQFEPPEGDTTDTDHTTILPAAAHQAVEKVKDVFR